jgi:hypothetical protein
MTTTLDAISIARLSLHDPTHFAIQHSQTLHRQQLLQHWNVTTGSKVLELGCGQGDCTTVLANAVGGQGSVVALDPADLNYGLCLLMLLLLPETDACSCKVHRIHLAKHKPTSPKGHWVN